jgi:hypothetical protein
MVISLAPDYALAYWGLGSAYSRLGSTGQAEEYYRRYVELTGDAADPEVVEYLQYLEQQNRNVIIAIAVGIGTAVLFVLRQFLNKTRDQRLF